MVYIAAIVILEKEDKVLLKGKIIEKLKHLLAGLSIITAVSFCI